MIGVDQSSDSLAENSSSNGEIVYLLHGFGGKPVLMARVARRLRREGYTVRNWSYHSVRKRVAEHAERLRDDVARITGDGDYSRVHFVTHSLGGIVVRQMLCNSLQASLGRIVMLCPPNAGSHIARLSSMFLRGLCPVLREISDRDTSFVNGLGVPDDAEIGVIAGSGDWVVRRSSTHLPNQRDHIVVRGGHLRLPFLRSAVEQTSHFIRHGTFNHEMVTRQARRHRVKPDPHP
ncbi:MAG: esterase/lipase family protein [Planctomycetota bacterium]|jgi:pimeloyl-ACP methyl ester carboxylesterase